MKLTHREKSTQPKVQYLKRLIKLINPYQKYFKKKARNKLISEVKEG